MSRRALLLLTVVSLITVGAVFGRGLLAGKPKAEPVAIAPPSALFVSPEKLDFGRVWTTARFEWSFPVTNRGSEPLSVIGIGSSCSCLSVSPPRFDLKPGETTTVTAVVDLTAKPRTTDEAAFLLTPIVELESKTPHPKVEWVLTGKSQRLLTLDRPPTFGRVSVLDQPLKTVSITVTTAIPLDLGLAAKSDHPSVAAAIRHDPKDDKKYTLELSATKPLPLCPVKGTVTLTPSDRREAKLSVIAVPFDALLVPDVECLPPAVLGGGHPVGATFTQSVTLASLGRRPFKELSVSADGAGLSVKQVGDEFLVTQQCQVAGQQTGKVVFQVEAADGRYAITADVTYVGVQD